MSHISKSQNKQGACANDLSFPPPRAQARRRLYRKHTHKLTRLRRRVKELDPFVLCIVARHQYVVTSVGKLEKGAAVGDAPLPVALGTPEMAQVDEHDEDT